MQFIDLVILRDSLAVFSFSVIQWEFFSYQLFGRRRRCTFLVYRKNVDAFLSTKTRLFLILPSVSETLWWVLSMGWSVLSNAAEVSHRSSGTLWGHPIS